MVFDACIAGALLPLYMQSEEKPASFLHYRCGFHWKLCEFLEQWNHTKHPEWEVGKRSIKEYELYPVEKKAAGTLYKRFSELNPKMVHIDGLLNAYTHIPDSLPQKREIGEELDQLTDHGRIEIMILLPTVQHYFEGKGLIFFTDLDGNLEIIGPDGKLVGDQYFFTQHRTIVENSREEHEV